ncbi:hypothetical protein APF79_11785 [bacterium BRH_c32]|nr:MAG: hypothetical protein APF79_11785 [bacterium BRH_c32]
MQSIKIKSILYISIIFFTLFILIGCSKDDNPVTAQEDHFQAIGMAIFDATGALNVKILRGVTSDTLKAEVGKRSDHYSIQFYNNEEKLIPPPTSENVKLDWKIEDTSLVGIWQHPGEEGGYEFHLEGIKKGNTTIEFYIVHEGHNDYRTGLIPVIVK